ncbi:MAG: glycosyltransferase [Bryobacteraceae bacterium]
MTNVPLLSAILMTPDAGIRLAKTLRSLAAQSIASRIEIVLAGPDRERLGLPGEMAACFWGVVAVETAMKSLGQMRAAAIRAAAGKYVVFCEDHSFPQKGWAEALVARLDEGFAGAGPGIDNANPGSALSWADILLSYGEFVWRREAAESTGLPWHNSAYVREELLAFGERLEFLCEADCLLQAELRAGGRKLLFEPRARIGHVNNSTARGHLGSLYWGNRLYGMTRRQFEEWPAARRILYAVCAPLAAVLRFRRVLEHVARLRGQHVRLPLGRLLPWLACGSVLAALAEATGYLLGPGATYQRRLHYELYRERYVRPKDRSVLSDS